MEIKQNIIEGLYVLLLGISVFLGAKVHYLFFSIPLLMLAAGYIYQKQKRRRSQMRRADELRKLWGKRIALKTDYKNIDAMYRLRGHKEQDFSIDDITWRDLDMNKVLERIDRTVSGIGLQYLYDCLKRPSANKAELIKRNLQIKSLQDNRELTVSMQQSLEQLGQESAEGLNEFMEGQSSFAEKSSLPLKLLSKSIFIIPAILFFYPQIGLYALILILFGNIFLYKRIQSKIAIELGIFSQLGAIIKCAKEIVKLELPGGLLKTEELLYELNKLQKLDKQLKTINLSTIFHNGGALKAELEVLLDYKNMVLLREPIAFYDAVHLLNKSREPLRLIYKELARLDAYASIASYRDSLDYYCEPEYEDNNKTVILSSSDAYHPLLEKPVANSLEIKGYGVLLTGSNASGKSTFLRTMGINAIFAQTICTVLAKEYKSNLIKVMTSIGNIDSIIEGDSYFMTEAKSIKRIVDELNKDKPVLCILDEIFRGTNTVERVSGATSVLQYLAAHNCCVIAATHDLELTRTVDEQYRNYHFREEVKENDIYFDYKLHQGACTSRNAILILKQLGYPAEVYQAATDMAVNFRELQTRLNNI